MRLGERAEGFGVHSRVPASFPLPVHPSPVAPSALAYFSANRYWTSRLNPGMAGTAKMACESGKVVWGLSVAFAHCLDL